VIDEPFELTETPEPEPLYSAPLWFYRVVASCCVVVTMAIVIAVLT
jgi:hypothetical protein